VDIDAIGFDIDGTLYPNSALFRRLAPFALARFRLVGAFRAVRHELRELQKRREYRAEPPASIEEFHRFQASLVARRLRWSEDRAAAAVETHMYGTVYRAFDGLPAFPGTGAALDRLKAAGFALGALSDLPVGNKLAALGLEDRFDVVCTSEETGFLKPAREPFELLARLLGAACERILYVGNSIRYDIEGAKAAGMKTALIAPSRARRGHGADIHARTYEELADAILGK
jgi:putative hydrolase of the HAD superfamily